MLDLMIIVQDINSTYFAYVSKFVNRMQVCFVLHLKSCLEFIQESIVHFICVSSQMVFQIIIIGGPIGIRILSKFDKHAFNT